MTFTFRLLAKQRADLSFSHWNASSDVWGGFYLAVAFDARYCGDGNKSLKLRRCFKV